MISAALLAAASAAPALANDVLTPAAQAVVERLQAAPGQSLAQQRLAVPPIALTGEPQPVRSVDDISVPTFRGPRAARLYRPVQTAEAPVLLWFHSGSWTRGNLETEDVALRAIANRSGWSILSVDYRLAPEHPALAAVDDAEAVFDWLVTRGFDAKLHPAHIAIGGNSAGANIAASLALRLRDAGRAEELSALLLVQPILDLTLSSQSWAALGERNYVIDRTGMERDVAAYLGGRFAADDPAVSPLAVSSLKGLPPTMIIAAGVDPARDDAIAFAARLSIEENAPKLTVFPGVPHGFFIFGAVLPEGAAAQTQIADWLRALPQAALGKEQQ